MRTGRIILSSVIMFPLGIVPMQQVAAETGKEFIIENVSSARYDLRSDSRAGRNIPDSLTLRVVDGSIDVAKDTPTGKQLEWNILDETSSATRTFEMDMAEDFSLSVHPESGAVIVESGGYPVAMINSPWAKDANGLSVPTYFTVEGKKIIQHVNISDANYAYPIVADPRVDWGIVSGHVYFSKEETRKAAAGSGAMAAISPFWLLIAGPVGQAVGLWWSSNTYSVTAWATAAVAQNKCLALKIGVTGSVWPPTVGVSPEHYTEGCV